MTMRTAPAIRAMLRISALLPLPTLVLLAAAPPPAAAQGDTIWGRVTAGSVFEVPAEVVTDGDDNVIVAGRFQGTADFGNGTVLTTSGNAAFLAKYDGSGNPIWAKMFPTALASVLITGMDLDEFNNIVISGLFWDSIDFGGGALVATKNEGTGNSSDFFIGMFDANGDHMWSRSFGTKGIDEGWGVTFDSWGNATLVGNYGPELDLGGPPLATGPSGYGFFVASFDKAGNHLSSHLLGPPGVREATIWGLTIDSSENYIVHGLFSGTFEMSGSSATSAGLFDAFIAKFDGDGNLLWMDSFGGPGIDFIFDAAVDLNDSIAITGALSRSIDENDGSEATLDVVVAKYDSDGDREWFNVFPAQEPSEILKGGAGRGIAIDERNNIAVTGGVSGRIDFGGGYLPFNPATSEAFAVLFDHSGSHLWSRSLPSDSVNTESNTNGGVEIAIDNRHDIIILGRFASMIDFGDGNIATSSSSVSALIAKLENQVFDPVIGLDITALNASSIEGSNASAQTFDLINAGVGLLDYTIADDVDWLSVSPNFGTVAQETDTITVNYANAALPPGTYHANLTVTSANATNSPQTLPVTLTVIPKPVMTLSTAALSQTIVAGNNAATQFFAVTNTGGSILDYTVSEPSSWLFVSPAAGTSTGESDAVSVIYDAAGLSAGTHTANIQVSASIAENSPQTVTVTLTVSEFGEQPLISVNPPALAQTVTAGENAAPQSFTVTNTGPGTLHYDVTDIANWLAVSPMNGSSTGETDTIDVAFTTASLPPGLYETPITVSDPNAANNPQTVMVSVTVNEGAAPQSIAVAPAILTQTALQGENAADKVFSLSNPGGGTLVYTITDNADWLSVSPASGSVAGETDTITVSYNSAALAAGTHIATITIDAPGAMNAPLQLIAQLTVFGAAPVSASAGSGGGGGGCFIATATYGTPMANEIDALRELRDAWLLTNALGTTFADAYYRISPPIADALAQSPTLRTATRAILAPIILLANAMRATPIVATAGVVLLLALALAQRRQAQSRRL